MGSFKLREAEWGGGRVEGEKLESRHLSELIALSRGLMGDFTA